MADESVHDIPAAQRKELLQAMLHSPAFALFCDRWDETIEREVEAKIFDTATSAEETLNYKRIRKLMTAEKHPRKVVEAMIRSTANEKPRT